MGDCGTGDDKVTCPGRITKYLVFRCYLYSFICMFYCRKVNTMTASYKHSIFNVALKYKLYKILYQYGDLTKFTVPFKEWSVNFQT